MKHIFLNLKRFDVPQSMGGVNAISDIRNWGAYIVEKTQKKLEKYRRDNVEFVMFFPELHILSAVEAKCEDSMILIGCQGVLYQDVEPRKNFGAFTTGRPAAAMCAAGCEYVLIGHCEERNKLTGILEQAGNYEKIAVNKILNQEIQAAQSRGMKVLYCIGETSEEQECWQEVLAQQLDIGLHGVDCSNITIAYEPVWSIGPGKIPASREYVTQIAEFVKMKTEGLDLVYGGGLKQENAKMLASIPEIDGGLVALTRFQDAIGFYPEEFLEIIDLYLES